jgi:hypothetical protein
MVPRIVTTAVLAAFALPAARALDLTPISAKKDLEGVQIPIVEFKDHGRTARYRPPLDWEYSGSAKRLSLFPANAPQASVEVTLAAVPDESMFSEKGIESLRNEVLSGLPRGSEDLRIVGENRNTVILERNESYEIVAEYKLSASRFKRSVIFLNLPGEQVRFQITAPPKDFDAVREEFRASMYSWEWQ